MNRFIMLIAFSIFVAEAMNNNRIVNLAVSGGAKGVKVVMELSKKEAITSGLNDLWMVIWMSALNSQLYQNPQGVLYIAFSYLMATATTTAYTAWNRAVGTFFNRFLASLYALGHMGWFGNFSIIVVALYSLLYFVGPFQAFSVPVAIQNIFTVIMMVVSVVVNALMYILGWRKIRRNSNLVNCTVPSNWAYIFMFSMYAMGILYSTNVIDRRIIDTSLKTYGALTAVNQMVVKMQPTIDRKMQVMNFFNNCYEKTANKCIYLLPVVGYYLVPLAVEAYNNYILSSTTM